MTTREQNIYDQYNKAFADVSAYLVTKEGDPVASIALKRPHGGEEYLYAYIKVFNVGMVKGKTSGYGYDKHGTAIEEAVHKIKEYIGDDKKTKRNVEAFKKALWDISTSQWFNKLRMSGFDVISVV